MPSMAVALDTRTRILDATIDLLAAGGDSAVRLALVAEALDISEPSIYHHFKNRSELITEAYSEWYWRCLKLEVPVDNIMMLVDTKEDYLRAVLKSMSWSYKPDRIDTRSIRISVLGAAQTNPELREKINVVNQKFLTSLAEALITAQQKGWVRTDLDPMATAYWLHGQINGRVVAEMNPGVVDLEKWDAVSYEVVRHLLA